MTILRTALAALSVYLCLAAPARACDFCMLGQGVNPYLTATGRGLTLQSTEIESNKIYDGSRAVDSHGKKEGWLIYTLTGFYPLAEGVTILASLPYAAKTNIDYDSAAQTNPGEYTSGLADISLTGRFTLFNRHSLDSTWLAGVLTGLKLPTGSTKETTSAGENDDRHALPGTGSFDYHLGVTSSFSSARGYQVTFDAVYTFTGVGKWGNDRHRYGNGFNGSLKGYYRVWPRALGEKSVFLFTGPLVEFTGKERGVRGDSGYDYVLNQSSGGTVGFWDFGIYAPLSTTTILSASFAKAVYHNMNFNGAYDADPAESYKLDLSATFLF